MITYSKEAQASYIAQIEKIQKELAEVPNSVIEHTSMHWLIHTALEDLKKQVRNEHK